MALESDNHIVLGDEPAWPVFVDEVAAFLAPDRTPRPAGGRHCRRCCRRVSSTCSRLAAEGHDNDEIAAGSP